MHISNPLQADRHNPFPGTPGLGTSQGLPQGPVQVPGRSMWSSASPADASGGTGNSQDSSTGEATITANDFLTLLVTELKNQDPTSTSDPNEYVDQLVQVNSLQQLIDINQDLAPLSGTGSDTSSDAAGKSSISLSPTEASQSASAVQVASSLAPETHSTTAVHSAMRAPIAAHRTAASTL